MWWLVPVGSVIAFAAQWWMAHVQPEAGTWTEVVHYVAAEWTEGDGLWITPVWHEIPWQDVEDSFEAQNKQVSGNVIWAKRPQITDIARYQRLWVISVGPWAEDFDGIGDVVTQREFGDSMVVSLIKRSTPDPRFDALTHLPQAEVVRQKATGNPDRCAWTTDRFRCGSQPWKDVRARVAQVGATRRRVIVTTAFPDNGVLTLTYRGVSLGSVLEGGVGNTLWAVRNKVGSTVSYRVFVANQQVYEVNLEPGDFSWVPFRIEVGKPGGGPADVRVEISAANTGWRELGFDLLSY